MWYREDAQTVPPMNKAQDLMQFTMSFPPKKLYIRKMG